MNAAPLLKRVQKRPQNIAAPLQGLERTDHDHLLPCPREGDVEPPEVLEQPPRLAFPVASDE